MHLNLTDPDSIVSWWRTFPERHWAYLAVFESRSPQFRLAIRAARARIQADPLFSLDRVRAFDDAMKQAWDEAERLAHHAEPADDPAAVLH
ncbi:MAG: hypothetical protein EKK53_23060 [Burkholderiales bacterium]|nr:MAG: hypothetical protein EKK53_23060 [Burkholderiales bacterium]